MRRTNFPGFITGCLILASVMLSACGGGDGGSSTGNADAPDDSINASPTISGTPGSSAVVGQTYSFQPAAADANGDRLSFTVDNLPGWASFSTETGRISGTPTAAQVGAYENITITVSDGAASARLGPFAINVTDVSSNSATLSWTPPTQNADGSALSNLAGYQVKYGRSASDLDQTVTLDNPSINRYVVENLSAGTWYFAVIAVNSRGTVSRLSNTASKTVS